MCVLDVYAMHILCNVCEDVIRLEYVSKRPYNNNLTIVFVCGAESYAGNQ